MYVMQNLPWFILFIGALILVHELGHFAVAKLIGIKVQTFSFGFGPKLFAVTLGETEYRLSAFLIGGYVKMLGEVPGTEIPPEDAPRAFSAKSVWQRSAVVLAGPFANFILAWVVYFGLTVGTRTVDDTRLGIVSDREPAWEAGLRPGDRVLRVDGVPVRDWEELREAISERPGASLHLAYERDGQTIETVVVPRAQDEANLFQELEKRGRVGISPHFVKAVVGVVDPESPAASAGVLTGDVVVQVSGRPVAAWHELRRELARTPPAEPMRITVERGNERLDFALTPSAAPAGLDLDLFSSADVPGRYTGLVTKESMVTAVEPGTPAAGIGLSPGDRLLRLVIEKEGRRIDRPIGVWGIDLLAFDGVDARSDFILTYQHGREVISRPFKLEPKEEKDDLKNKRTRYVFGAMNDVQTRGKYTTLREIGVQEAMRLATRAVGASATVVAKGIAKLAKREIPLETMGGPIMLFQIAAESAKQGIEYFLSTMALISVNLGLLNLMPIPVLDGGHMLIFGIEAIRRRPPSLRFREVANLIGLALLLLLMLLVFHNDIRRLLLG
ncbi:MAG: site-2 protease family protein [Deltaproteobacteria bacterium]|nr:site-2 protease family protein [Deltaproteobacteria bacterium]